jgi:hypothetical protein
VKAIGVAGLWIVSGLAAPAAVGHATHASGGAQPRVIQLSYSEVNDGSRPRLNLMAFSRRTEAVGLATRYQGKQATADTRFSKNITDTDIKGNRAKHPFVLVRKRGGKRVVKLVRDSLADRGEARVRIRATRGGSVDAIKLRIVLTRCSLDPPLFPVDCEVERSGKHV